MKGTGMIHFARFEDSNRLQRLLEYMLHGEPRTGLEIINGAKITAVSAAACELRLNGFDLECIRQNDPSIYQLFNTCRARELSIRLLQRKAA
jgi:hypothetical protein